LKVLIKLGGTLLDSPDSRQALAAQIAVLSREGYQTVVVHGGGKQMTRFLAERGVESRFEGGLRVTTPEVLDAVLKVFAGSVNKELVAALIAAGSAAVGICGVDAVLAEAEPMSPALGSVGRILRTNPRVLDALADAGFLPVVACVAGDRQGGIYNVNADQMAAALAAGHQSDRVLFLTDVPGVRDSAGALVSRLTAAQAEGLIREGVATGGMQAKLTYAMEALKSGAGEIVIAPGAAADVVTRLLAGEMLGTHLVRESA
jgi:acetylglutamate kinase